MQFYRVAHVSVIILQHTSLSVHTCKVMTVSTCELKSANTWACRVHHYPCNYRLTHNPANTVQKLQHTSLSVHTLRTGKVLTQSLLNSTYPKYDNNRAYRYFHEFIQHASLPCPPLSKQYYRLTRISPNTTQNLQHTSLSIRLLHTVLSHMTGSILFPIFQKTQL